MDIYNGLGDGVHIAMTGDEVALAITAWLVARGVHIDGPRTIRVNGELCTKGHVYVDPSGSVVFDGQRITGRGPDGSSTSGAEVPA